MTGEQSSRAHELPREGRRTARTMAERWFELELYLCGRWMLLCVICVLYMIRGPDELGRFHHPIAHHMHGALWAHRVWTTVCTRVKKKQSDQKWEWPQKKNRDTYRNPNEFGQVSPNGPAGSWAQVLLSFPYHYTIIVAGSLQQSGSTAAVAY